LMDFRVLMTKALTRENSPSWRKTLSQSCDKM
jgi:hypothetical protein